MSAVVFVVGLCGTEDSYNDLMFGTTQIAKGSKDPWSIKNKVIGRLPAGTPNLITRWDHDVAAEINKNFPDGDVVLIGHSYGGCKAAQISLSLNRPIKKLILIDPVEINKGNVINTTGFTIGPNVIEAECYYRIAKSTPYSAGISRVAVTQNGQLQTKITNVIYPCDGKDPWADHGKYVWDGKLVATIKAAL
jgi:pimeloyl-ACP methyl ester carboxylesterase